VRIDTGLRPPPRQIIDGYVQMPELESRGNRAHAKQLSDVLPVCAGLDPERCFAASDSAQQISFSSLCEELLSSIAKVALRPK
jgi:hypothetical protein